MSPHRPLLVTEKERTGRPYDFIYRMYCSCGYWSPWEKRRGKAEKWHRQHVKV